MSNNSDLKDNLKNRVEDNKNVALAKPKETIEGLLLRMKPQIEKAIPKHMSSERLLRIALTNIRLNPKLMQCNQASLLGAIMQSAQLGLEPGLLGQAYLIPYYNNKNKNYEVNFQIGYKGLLDLVRRSGQVSTIFAGEVKENDEFEYEYGLEHKLKHKPLVKGQRGETYCYYAYALMNDGGTAFYVMSKEDINRIRDTYSKSKDNGPWVSEYDSMAKKTVLKQLIKYLPLSVEIIKDIAADETTKTDVAANMAEDVLDISYMGSDVIEDVDHTDVKE